MGCPSPRLFRGPKRARPVVSAAAANIIATCFFRHLELSPARALAGLGPGISRLRPAIGPPSGAPPRWCTTV
eukprot:9483932-Pyramimonas_sp.AAC.1